MKIHQLISVRHRWRKRLTSPWDRLTNTRAVTHNSCTGRAAVTVWCIRGAMDFLALVCSWPAAECFSWTVDRSQWGLNCALGCDTWCPLLALKWSWWSRHGHFHKAGASSDQQGSPALAVTWRQKTNGQFFAILTPFVCLIFTFFFRWNKAATFF